MIGYIWGAMIILSVIVSIINGNAEATMNSAFEGANSAIENLLSFTGAMCMWMGLIKIAEKSGIINSFSRFITPVTKLIFPHIKKDSPAHKSISMNMVANLLGLGNAATPLGIKAMEELNRLNPDKKTATNEMCMLVVLNTASIQVIPSTLIAIRSSLGSQNPSEVIVPIWIASVITAVIAISITKFCGLNKYHINQKRKLR